MVGDFWKVVNGKKMGISKAFEELLWVNSGGGGGSVFSVLWVGFLFWGVFWV